MRETGDHNRDERQRNARAVRGLLEVIDGPRRSCRGQIVGGCFVASKNPSVACRDSGDREHVAAGRS